MLNQRVRIYLSFVLLTTSGTLLAEDRPEGDKPDGGKKARPQWEFGVGIGAVDIPHYRGSDQRDTYVAPLPYVRYRGERLKVDREGGRYFFINRDRVKLDISAAFMFPVDSDDNTARQGMPDLDPILEVGPRLQWYLFNSRDHRFRIRAGLPLRVAVNIPEFRNEGWILSPYLQFRYFSGMETALSLGPMWASEKYHDYYYQVDAQHANSNRPEYDARAGYNGFRITLTNNQRINRHWWWGGFARYDSLSGAVFEDSPLVKRKDAYMFGLVFSYIFKPVENYYLDRLEE